MSELKQDSEAPFRTPVLRSTFVVLGVIVGAGVVVLASLGILRGRIRDGAGKGDLWRRVPEQVGAIELKAFETPPSLARDRKQLHEFGWVDRKRGVVHVPIDLAMELYLERGRGPL